MRVPRAVFWSFPNSLSAFSILSCVAGRMAPGFGRPTNTNLTEEAKAHIPCCWSSCAGLVPQLSCLYDKDCKRGEKVVVTVTNQCSGGRGNNGSPCRHGAFDLQPQVRSASAQGSKGGPEAQLWLLGEKSESQREGGGKGEGRERERRSESPLQRCVSEGDSDSGLCGSAGEEGPGLRECPCAATHQPYRSAGAKMGTAKSRCTIRQKMGGCLRWRSKAEQGTR